MNTSRASIVFVLGMHRSGTSLATRMVETCGFQVPGQALSANADNPEGYSEPRALVRANNRILTELGRHWADDRPIEAAQQQVVFNAWHKRAMRLLRAWLARDARLVLKDPRLCLVFPLWQQAARELDADIRVLLIRRNVHDVSASLARRYANPVFRPAAIVQTERSELLWQRYSLWAEWHSRGCTRAHIEYEQLVAGDIEPLRRLLHPWWPQNDGPIAMVQAPPRAKYEDAQNLAGQQLPAASPDDVHQQHHNDRQRQAYDKVQARYAELRTDVPSPPQTDRYAAQLLRAFQHAVASASGARGHVVFISDSPASRGHIYRVEHAATALATHGLRVDISETPQQVQWSDDTCAVVLFRLRWNAELATLAARCKQRGIALIYDIDDAVFDSALMTPAHFDYLRVRRDQHEHWQRSAPQYREALQQCDAAMLTTAALAARAQPIQPNVHVVPNGLAPNRMSASPRRAERDLVRIGYASGTPTHQKDFAEVAEALVEVLARHAQVQLCVLGHLNLEEFPALDRFTHQIEQRDLVGFDQLPQELARFDINLAPLQRDNPFCDCKSELKYFEAAAVGVVTVASATPPMREAIIDGHTGFIAANHAQWLSHLNDLIEHPDRREACARRARLHARACYGPEARGEWYVSVFSQIVEHVQARKSGFEPQS